MPDRGRDLEFGVFVDPRAARYAATVAHVRTADRLGLDLAGLQDHPHLPEHLDTWTLLVDLAARTERIRVFPDVADLPLRPPAVLARAAASLDVVTGGRVDLGLGAGGYWDAIAAMGGPRRTPGEAVTALAEAVDVVRALWSGQRGVRAGGDTCALAGVHAGPVPGRRIEIWIGALGPRMLDLTGRVADGWLPSSAHVPPADLAGRDARIDEAAAAAGRDPADVRRLDNVSGTITGSAGTGFLQGPSSGSRSWPTSSSPRARTPSCCGRAATSRTGCTASPRRSSRPSARRWRGRADAGPRPGAAGVPGSGAPARAPREDDVTDPAATPPTTPHSTPHATAQDGLAVASALLRATDERVTAVHVGRQHLTVTAPPYPARGSAGPSPLGLLAAALASDAALALRSHLDSTYSYGGDLEVVVAVRPGWVLDYRVTHTEDLDADQQAGAREVAEQAPLTRVLGPAVEVRTTFERISALTR